MKLTMVQPRTQWSWKQCLHDSCTHFSTSSDGCECAERRLAQVWGHVLLICWLSCQSVAYCDAHMRILELSNW